MVLENLAVVHSIFGPGTIIARKDKYISVKFASVEKTFVYPDAFDKFLRLDDGTVPEEILTDLTASKAEKQRLIDKKTEENIHSMTHGIVIPGKESLNVSEDEEPGYKSALEEEI